MRQQRVIVAQEAADDEHAVERGEFGDRHAEPGHAAGPGGSGVRRKVGLAQTKIDVVAAKAAHQLLRQMQLLQRRVRRGQRADGFGAVAVDDALQLAGGEFERGLPVRFDQLPIAPEQWHRQPIVRVESLVGKPVLVRQPAFVDRLVFQRHDTHDFVVLDLDDQIAAQAVVR